MTRQETTFTQTSAEAAQLWAPQNGCKAPLMVIYEKSFRRYATSRGRMAFKTKYPNCRHNFGRTRTVSRFWGLWGQDTFVKGGKIFLSYVWNKFFWDQQNLGGIKKIWGVTSPKCSPRVCGPGQNRCQKVFYFGPSSLCRRTRRSKNLYLIPNMNSICRLCK